jgi:hypothetical protein
MRARDGLREKREAEEAAPELRLEQRQDGQLWAIVGARELPVRVRRCFPWSAPGEWVSLRDDAEDEVALVRGPGELDSESRRALERSLEEAGFVIDVRAVELVEDEIEIRTFRVRTPSGTRSFQTLRDEWPRETPDGALLLKDVAGDLYRVRDPRALDRRSRRRLSALVD